MTSGPAHVICVVVDGVDDARDALWAALRMAPPVGGGDPRAACTDRVDIAGTACSVDHEDGVGTLSVLFIRPATSWAFTAEQARTVAAAVRDLLVVVGHTGDVTIDLT